MLSFVQVQKLPQHFQKLIQKGHRGKHKEKEPQGVRAQNTVYRSERCEDKHEGVQLQAVQVSEELLPMLWGGDRVQQAVQVSELREQAGKDQVRGGKAVLQPF